jgi:hypothetical protein
MGIVSALCNSYKGEILQGIHAAADTYKIALFTSAASLDKATVAYSATNEVVGAGYVAGGKALAGFAISQDADVACLDFDSPVWASASITARGALIYNASKANKAVTVVDFGADVTSTNDGFTAQFPVPGALTSAIRIE